MNNSKKHEAADKLASILDRYLGREIDDMGPIYDCIETYIENKNGLYLMEKELDNQDS